MAMRAAAAVLRKMTAEYLARTAIILSYIRDAQTVPFLVLLLRHKIFPLRQGADEG